MSRGSHSHSGSHNSGSHGSGSRPSAPHGPDPRVPVHTPDPAPPAHTPGSTGHQGGDPGGAARPGHDPQGRTPSPGADPGTDPADGGDAADPRESWWKGALRSGAESAGGSLGEHAGDWAGEKVFGSGGQQEPEPGGGEAPTGLDGLPPTDGAEPGGEDPDADFDAQGDVPDPGFAGGPVGSGATTGSDGGMSSTLARRDVQPYGGGSSAYDWAHAQVQQAMDQLQPAEHPSRGGLGGMLDEAVEYALKESGLIEMLEKVTGNLAELNAAAEEWQAQAGAVQQVAAELRGGAVPVSQAWEGQASDSFGGHMGEVADALDQTAEGMRQTAQIINSAAQECAAAEGMVVEIISEAIEALIASLAAEAVIAVVTAGIGLIADALITEAEITVFVARVARVSTELAQKLEELLKALKELGSAVKAVKNLQTARSALAKVKEVKTAVQGLRDFEEGGDGLGKLAGDAFRNRSLDGVGSGLKDFAVRQAVRQGDEFVTGKAEDAFSSALGLDDGAERGDGTVKGAFAAAGRSALGVAKETVLGDTNRNAVTEELLHDTGLERDPAPYRVDTTRIEAAFG
ncbi:WXG100 family type VII secretion target [Kitasatospora sp. NPDC049285]|uniref:WXG100 family type VII secretion target n=1 Tax=Kitasatospora sp. NPDC049285 TaxID=3157096 RepID=UPI00343FA21D